MRKLMEAVVATMFFTLIAAVGMYCFIMPDPSREVFVAR
jgi:hypothetical protein